IVDGQFLQVAQRGIAGPKVVQGDAHPQFLQFLELPGGFPDIVHDHALGDFQVQVRRLRPVSASVAATVSARSPRANCTAEVLTATCMGPYPASRHNLPWRQASCSTRAPIGMMSPLSSAIGIRTDGGTRPNFGLSQRTSASNPATRPVAKSNCGW